MDKFVKDFEARHPNASSSGFNAFFNDNSDHYQSARPGYPPQLIDDLLSFVPEPKLANVLEIGAGNGVATAKIAPNVRSVIAIEPGEHLLAQARKNCNHLENIDFRLAAFEDIEAVSKYDVIAAFTSFHWVRAENKFQRVAEMLTDSGVFAACWNSYMPPKGELGSGISIAIAEATSSDAPVENATDVVQKSLSKLSTRELEIQGQMEFAICGLRRYVKNYTYDADRYCALLNTFPNISSLSEDTKQQLFRKVIDLMRSQEITIPVVSSLTVARSRASLHKILTKD